MPGLPSVITEAFPMFNDDICELPEQYAISLGLNQTSLEQSVDNIRLSLLTVVNVFTTRGLAQDDLVKYANSLS